MYMGFAVRFVLITIGLTVVTCGFLLLMSRSMRWARKGSPAATVIGWMMLMFTSGVNPQPPPQEQVEEANRRQKLLRQSDAKDPES
jgi:hypothetical protein